MIPFSKELFKAGKIVFDHRGCMVTDMKEYIESNGELCYAGMCNGYAALYTEDELRHPEEEMYVNIYEDENGHRDILVIHNTKEKAIVSIGDTKKYIGTYKLVKV